MSPSEPAPPGARPARLRRLSVGRGSAGVIIATVSTIVVVGVAGWAIVNSPGWGRVQSAFFDPVVFADSAPSIVRAFMLNVRIFLSAEALILLFALVLAVMRSVRGPVFFPIRLFAVAYTDFFRGVPSVLVVYLLGLGVPALRLEGVPTDPLFWGLVALVLVWTAYVGEVYRAGIESVHPSQDAAARSLGLSAFQSLRYVVLPQAVRRVVPPLLNDFIGLQKDTALVAFLGPIEAFRRAQIENAATFDFTPYLVSATLFLLLTIPLARLVEWLVGRDRRRYLAGAR